MITVVMLLEIAFLCLAGWGFFYTDNTRLADALALGIGLTLVSLSVSFQLAFLLGLPALSFLFEAIMLLVALFILRSRWRRLLLAWQRFRRFVATYWLTSLILGVCGSYLLLLVLLLPVSEIDTLVYNHTRVLLFQEQNTMLLSHVTKEHQAVFPVGSDILAHMFLRFYTDYGTALFGFLSYLVIVFGSYALARRYASPRLALCATLIVISMPKLVYQASSTKNDIVSAAAGLLCLLLLYRLSERPSGRDLLLLALMMSFGISTKTTFLAFLLPFVVLTGFILIRKHGWDTWWRILTSSWRGVVFITIPVLVLSQVWLFVHNMLVWGGWTGSPELVQAHQHNDGIGGAIANLLRYFFQTPDLLWLTDAASRYLTGQKLSGVIQWLYDTTIAPLVGDAGLGRYPFEIVWSANEASGGFGPMAFFVALPALGYAFLRGPLLLRSLVLIQIIYIFLWHGRSSGCHGTIVFLLFSLHLPHLVLPMR
ncbi:MAG: hypothetical protein HC837_03895 [Chloroflexaceae bacterium]|nr:hypothetical protein [Chloroflexaceae bacterium]